MSTLADAPTSRFGGVENALGTCTQCGADLCTTGDEVACTECNLPQLDHPETVRMKAETEQARLESERLLQDKRRKRAGAVVQVAAGEQQPITEPPRPAGRQARR